MCVRTARPTHTITLNGHGTSTPTSSYRSVGVRTATLNGVFRITPAVRLARRTYDSYTVYDSSQRRLDNSKDSLKDLDNFGDHLMQQLQN